MLRSMRTSAGAGMLTLLVLAVWWVAPDPRSIAPALADPQGYVDRVGADQAALVLVSLAAWAVLGWLALGLTVSAAAALPGSVGRGCDAISVVMLPAALRRTAAVALGLSVATAGGSSVVGAVAAHPSAPPAAGAAVSTAAGRPDRSVLPTLTPARDAPASPASDHVGAYRSPGHDAAARAATGIDWPSEPGPRQPPTRAGQPGGRIVVAPGDSLWSLAAARLTRLRGHRPSDSQIAAEWPRWYAANRFVIGGDPDLIQPGQHLLVPPAN